MDKEEKSRKQKAESVGEDKITHTHPFLCNFPLGLGT